MTEANARRTLEELSSVMFNCNLYLTLARQQSNSLLTHLGPPWSGLNTSAMHSIKADKFINKFLDSRQKTEDVINCLVYPRAQILGIAIASYLPHRKSSSSSHMRRHSVHPPPKLGLYPTDSES